MQDHLVYNIKLQEKNNRISVMGPEILFLEPPRLGNESPGGISSATQAGGLGLWYSSFISHFKLSNIEAGTSCPGT